MKHHLKLLLALAVSGIFMIGCGTNNSENDGGRSNDENTSAASDIVSGVKNLDNLKDGASKMEAMQNQLKNATKLNTEELKAFFPETFNGWRRIGYSGGSQLYGVDVATASAVYDAGEKELHISLTDGAGEAGAAIVSLMAMGLAMDSEKESEYDKEKNEVIGGHRAATRESKIQQEGDVVDSEISFIHNDRYLIKLDGDGFPLTDLKEIVGKIDYNILK
ncbi:hypothetical protein [Sphingobacterium sp. LRF_L2]|uniref:hypothetical protein n=1 Tax=Sphingobacterium sp. LRF_L2 TaxID=3369421 RepID=UPI003F6292D2